MGLLEHVTDDELLKNIPESVSNMPIFDFDPGVFDNELRALNIEPPSLNLGAENPLDDVTYSKGNIVQGTYGGTQAAVHAIFNRVERGFASYFDAIGIESSLPRSDSLEKRRQKYRWATIEDDRKITALGYPPHLKSIPRDAASEDGTNDAGHHFGIYDALGLAETSLLLPKIIPDEFVGGWANSIKKVEAGILHGLIEAVYGDPESGTTIKALEENNKNNRKTGTDIMQGKNIGLYDDWFSDAKYGQFQFTACNPVTITAASDKWVQEFAQAAQADNNTSALDLLRKADRKSLYVQDASYFREATGAAVDADMHNKQKSGDRWACAAVSLFHLQEDGKLHPLAIIIDYKGSIENSVTIFNRRLQPGTGTLEEERTDWPWRYAKTCAQVSDWTRHEMTVHLVETHLVEEVIIVATQRTLPSGHPILRLLEPHWYKTLSKNAGARETLVPNIIFDLVGFTGAQPFAYLWHAFRSFDFVGRYVPHDLAARGFPLAELDAPRFRNYAYARNVKLMWDALRRYVAAMVALAYPDDAAVAADAPLAAWCAEIQGPGQLASFPTVATRDALVDAVTMCIHIAAPQHTAVNYLQNFYQAFVISKPPMLCAAPPRDLAALRAFGEPQLLAALPVHREREWLLAAQIPMILSFAVTEERNMVAFAQSLWRVYYRKEGAEAARIKEIAAALYGDLRKLAVAFRDHSLEVDDGSGKTVPYMVMDPGNTAVSILL
ncbi:hypothetical protein FH972_022695 [Carpinus fangiana]|uniref:Lipoxygenase domain-containing protein n=1 Tax=Carpinus fangiana TaxID=176857 RepID=A0A5N6KTI9_9ROSI|nr:hypothetical protein FH972_022695 [Carpinus fangiana]